MYDYCDCWRCEFAHPKFTGRPVLKDRAKIERERLERALTPIVHWANPDAVAAFERDLLRREQEREATPAPAAETAPAPAPAPREEEIVADGDEWASSDALLALEQDIWRAEVKEWEDEEKFLREQEAREEKVREDEKRQWREWEDAVEKEQWRGLLAEAHRARLEGVRREREKLAVGNARLLEAKGCGFEVDWSIVL